MMNTWEIKKLVASGTTASIDRGTPTKNSSQNVAIMVDGDGTTSQLFTGMAKNASNETSSAAGSVEVWFPAPSVEYRGSSTTAANSNTQAKIDALQHKRVNFDLIATVWSIDDAVADATTNCVYITGGDYHASQLTFIYSVAGSLANPTT